MVDRLRSVDLDRDLLMRFGLPIGRDPRSRFFYPQYVESLQDLPAIGDFVPSRQLDGDHDRLHDDGRRPEHRRRLRGTARPRLRRLLRGRRVRGGLVRVAAVRPVDVPLRLGRDQQGRARDPSLDLARPAAGGPLHDGGRHPDRPADAAAARRLPRDRDARLRRDRPAGRAQRRQRLRLRPHARHVRDQPDRLARLRQPSATSLGLPAQLPAVVRARAVVLLDRARAAPDHRLLLGAAARLPARPRLDRDPRGRDGGGRDGRAADADEDLVVRARRLLRRRRGRLLLRASRAARSRRTSTSTSRSSCSAWSSSAGWAASGACSSAG